MNDASASEPAGGPIETVLAPKVRELAEGFTVRRSLPQIGRRSVGPFVFLDQMGPTVLAEGQGLDVLSHPHIGLATVTYLFQGAIDHRDSLGTFQTIRPGDVNWMTAGRGIVHSERTPPSARKSGAPLFGVQSWVALPKSVEETEPAFAHHGAADLPVLADGGMRLRLIAGAYLGARAPTKFYSDIVYADIELPAGARLPLAPEHEEQAIYVVEGKVELDGRSFEPAQLVVLRPMAATLTATSGARVMLLGGARTDGPRHMWWNFVSSSKERIEQAKADWKAGRFPVVPGETGFVPLPE